jgi:hypothetical protein
MWRAAGAVLAIAVVATVMEVLASDKPILSAWSGVFPLVGAMAAPVVGPRLRPRMSFNLGRVFLVAGTLSAALSAHVWGGTPIGVAEMFHYVTAMMFAAVFFDRRDVYQLLGLITVLNTVVVFADGYTPARLLVWFLSMLVTAIVVDPPDAAPARPVVPRRAHRRAEPSDVGPGARPRGRGVCTARPADGGDDDRHRRLQGGQPRSRSRRR